MPTTQATTERQRVVLSAVDSLSRRLGCSPTYAELAAECGLRSAATSFRAVCKLERAGLLRVCRRRARSVMLTDEGRESLRC